VRNREIRTTQAKNNLNGLPPSFIDTNTFDLNTRRKVTENRGIGGMKAHGWGDKQ
jgi:hypothetical protein